MKYSVIGKPFQEVYREYGNTEEIDIMMESFYQKQNEIFSELFPNDETVIYHYFDSDFRNGLYMVGVTSEISDYIDSLAIKDGVNLVRYENGNVGFMAVYSGTENGFEIISGTMENLRKVALSQANYIYALSEYEDDETAINEASENDLIVWINESF